MFDEDRGVVEMGRARLAGVAGTQASQGQVSTCRRHGPPGLLVGLSAGTSETPRCALEALGSESSNAKPHLGNFSRLQWGDIPAGFP